MYFPEFKAFIDVTEQEIQRPKDKNKKRNYYSGKKKKHTVRTQEHGKQRRKDTSQIKTSQERKTG